MPKFAGMITYTVVHLSLEPTEAGRDLAVALLSHAGYDSFLETEAGLEAYIDAQAFDAEALTTQCELLREAGFEVDFTLSTQEPKNWNEEWENNFDPVEVGRLCRIRAPFHTPSEGFDQEIVIMPKMSFGTGHHATTHMMVKLMMQEGVTDPVLDMGCGTSVLAILAHKLGARQITAIDIDEWAYTNSLENVEMNNASPIEVLQGDVTLIAGRTFNTILANINRNVLLTDIAAYARAINLGGKLFISGFYTQDLPDIIGEAERQGFRLLQTLERNNWASAILEK